MTQIVESLCAFAPAPVIATPLATVYHGHALEVLSVLPTALYLFNRHAFEQYFVPFLSG